MNWNEKLKILSPSREAADLVFSFQRSSVKSNASNRPLFKPFREYLRDTHSKEFITLTKAFMEEDYVIDLESVDIFQQESLVLSDVDLKVAKGEFVFLIGATGSGKSSLLKTLYGELKLRKGQAKVAGFDLKKLRSKKVPYLRRKLGIVFQDFQLLTDRSVLENLLFVMRATGWKDKAQIKARIDEVLESVELPTKGFKMPHQLSGGEQQRAAIARALINHPSIILADEPTGNLDPETSSRILALLRKISETGTTVIMATHDYDHMQKFDARILRCENGKLVDAKSLSTI